MRSEQHSSFGVHGVFATRICQEPATAEGLAKLLVDPRWPWLMNLYEYDTLAPRKRFQKRDKALTRKDGAARLAKGLLAPDRSTLHLMSSPSIHEVRAECAVSTGREVSPWIATPYKLHIVQRRTSWPEHASVRDWLEVVHDAMAVCRVACGVIAGWLSYEQAASDASLGGGASIREQIPADIVAENRAVAPYRIKLGGDMVRPPRWGTYLARRWVEQLGGRSAIEAVAAPYAIRELGGDVIFVQLTESIESSQSPQCEQKRLALRELMRPILPPGIPALG